MSLSEHTARQLIEALRGTTENLNVARLIMADKETRDLASEVVADNQALLEQAEREMVRS